MGNNTETKNAAFLRLSDARKDTILDGIRKLGNLSNRAAYEYSEDEVEQVFDALHDALETSHQKFRGNVKIRQTARTNSYTVQEFTVGEEIS